MADPEGVKVDSSLLTETADENATSAMSSTQRTNLGGEQAMQKEDVVAVDDGLGLEVGENDVPSALVTPDVSIIEEVPESPIFELVSSKEDDALKKSQANVVGNDDKRSISSKADALDNVCAEEKEDSSKETTEAIAKSPLPVEMKPSAEPLEEAGTQDQSADSSSDLLVPLIQVSSDDVPLRVPVVAGIVNEAEIYEEIECELAEQKEDSIPVPDEHDSSCVLQEDPVEPVAALPELLDSKGPEGENGTQVEELQIDDQADATSLANPAPSTDEPKVEADAQVQAENITDQAACQSQVIHAPEDVGALACPTDANKPKTTEDVQVGLEETQVRCEPPEETQMPGQSEACPDTLESSETEIATKDAQDDSKAAADQPQENWLLEPDETPADSKDPHDDAHGGVDEEIKVACQPQDTQMTEEAEPLSNHIDSNEPEPVEDAQVEEDDTQATFQPPESQVSKEMDVSESSCDSHRSKSAKDAQCKALATNNDVNESTTMANVAVQELSTDITNADLDIESSIQKQFEATEQNEKATDTDKYCPPAHVGPKQLSRETDTRLVQSDYPEDGEINMQSSKPTVEEISVKSSCATEEEASPISCEVSPANLAGPVPNENDVTRSNTFKPIDPSDSEDSDESSKSLETAKDLPKLEDISGDDSFQSTRSALLCQSAEMAQKPELEINVAYEDDLPVLTSSESVASLGSIKPQEPDGDMDFLNQTSPLSVLDTSTETLDILTTSIENRDLDAPGEVITNISKDSMEQLLNVKKVKLDSESGLSNNDCSASPVVKSAELLSPGTPAKSESPWVREPEVFDDDPETNASFESLTSYISAEPNWEGIELVHEGTPEVCSEAHVHPPENQAASEGTAEDPETNGPHSIPSSLLLAESAPSTSHGDPLLARISQETSNRDLRACTASAGVQNPISMSHQLVGGEDTPVARMRNAHDVNTTGRVPSDPDGAVISKAQDPSLLGGLKKVSITSHPSNCPKPRVSFAAMHKGPHYERNERLVTPFQERPPLREDLEPLPMKRPEGNLRRARLVSQSKRKMYYDEDGNLIGRQIDNLHLEDDEESFLGNQFIESMPRRSQEGIPEILDPVCRSVESSFTTLVSKQESADDGDNLFSALEMLMGGSKFKYDEDSESDCTSCSESEYTYEDDDARSTTFFSSFFTDGDTRDNTNLDLDPMKWFDELALQVPVPELGSLLRAAADVGLSDNKKKVTHGPRTTEREQEGLSEFVDKLEKEERLEKIDDCNLDHQSLPFAAEPVSDAVVPPNAVVTSPYNPTASSPAVSASKTSSQPNIESSRPQDANLETQLSVEQQDCGVLTLEDFHELARMAAEAIDASHKKLKKRPLRLPAPKTDSNVSNDSMEAAWDHVEYTVDDLDSVTRHSLNNTGAKSKAHDRITAKLEHIKKTQPQIYKVFLAKMAAAERAGRKFDFRREDILGEDMPPMERNSDANQIGKSHEKGVKADERKTSPDEKVVLDMSCMSNQSSKISVKIQVETPRERASTPAEWEKFDTSPFKDPTTESQSFLAKDMTLDTTDVSVFDDFKWLTSAKDSLKDSFASTVEGFMDVQNDSRKALQHKLAQYSKTHPTLYRILLAKIAEKEGTDPAPASTDNKGPARSDKDASINKTKVEGEPLKQSVGESTQAPEERVKAPTQPLKSRQEAAVSENKSSLTRIERSEAQILKSGHLKENLGEVNNNGTPSKKSCRVEQVAYTSDKGKIGNIGAANKHDLFVGCPVVSRPKPLNSADPWDFPEEKRIASPQKSLPNSHHDKSIPTASGNIISDAESQRQSDSMERGQSEHSQHQKLMGSMSKTDLPRAEHNVGAANITSPADGKPQTVSQGVPTALTSKVELEGEQDSRKILATKLDVFAKKKSAQADPHATNAAVGPSIAKAPMVDKVDEKVPLDSEPSAVNDAISAALSEPCDDPTDKKLNLSLGKARTASEGFPTALNMELKPEEEQDSKKILTTKLKVFAKKAGQAHPHPTDAAAGSSIAKVSITDKVDAKHTSQQLSLDSESCGAGASPGALGEPCDDATDNQINLRVNKLAPHQSESRLTDRSKTPVSSNRRRPVNDKKSRKRDSKYDRSATPRSSNRSSRNMNESTRGKTREHQEAISRPKAEVSGEFPSSMDHKAASVREQPSTTSSAPSTNWETFDGSNFKDFVMQSFSNAKAQNKPVEEAIKYFVPSRSKSDSPQIDLQESFLDSILPPPPSFPAKSEIHEQQRDPWDFSEAAGAQWEHFSPLSFDSNLSNWGVERKKQPQAFSQQRKRPNRKKPHSSPSRKKPHSSPSSIAEF
jgi:hypothetical protein